jgi:hypothetical protein
MTKDIGRLTIHDLKVVSGDREPRLRDLRLSGRLGYDVKNSHRFRYLLDRHEDEFLDYGALTRIESKSTGGRPAIERWLNESQAILACFLSRAPNARPIRKEVIDTFLAYRRGERPNTPLTDAFLALPAPEITRDANVLRVNHEDWQQRALFDEQNASPVAIAPERDEDDVQARSIWAREANNKQAHTPADAYAIDRWIDQTEDGARIHVNRRLDRTGNPFSLSLMRDGVGVDWQTRPGQLLPNANGKTQVLILAGPNVPIDVLIRNYERLGIGPYTPVGVATLRYWHAI